MKKMIEYKYRKGKPVIPVLVGYKRKIELMGLIDSGADYCTVPIDVCEYLRFKKIKDIELNIPGGTLVVPIFRGMIGIDNTFKEIDIAGLTLPPKIDIDLLIGRNFFGDMDMYLLGTKQKFIIKI